MEVIWKFELSPKDQQEVLMPKNAEVLAAQAQNDGIMIWAKCDSTNDLERRIFVIEGTGHEITHSDLKYISTVQLHGGSLVFHVFEYLGI